VVGCSCFYKIEESIPLLKEMTSEVVRHVQTVEFREFDHHYQVTGRHAAEKGMKTFKEVLREHNDEAPARYTNDVVRNYMIFVTFIILTVFSIICLSIYIKEDRILAISCLCSTFGCSFIIIRVLCTKTVLPKAKLRYSSFKQDIDDHNANATDNLIGVVIT
jgi:hypothetical protein